MICDWLAICDGLAQWVKPLHLRSEGRGFKPRLEPGGPGLTRFVSDVVDNDKLATETKTRRVWTRSENMALMEWKSERGYMQRMWEEWLLRNPTSTLRK